MNFGLRKISYWSMILVLLLAAILRLDNITQPFIDDSAWRESSVAMMAENFYRKSWNIFYPEVNWVGPGPGYQGREFQTVSYIAALLYVVVGQHDWIGRCVAVAFGLVGIFALFRLTCCVWDERHAIIAASLMAVLPGVIRLERSFLPDPAMVALVVTSFWMLVLYLQTGHIRYLVLAALIGAWGNLTKIPGMIVGLPMLYAILSLLGRRGLLNARNITTLLIAGTLSALPVCAYYLWARHLAYSYPPYHFAGEGNWIWDQGLSAWAEQQYFLLRLWGPVIRLWSLPGLLLFCLGFVLAIIKKPALEARSSKENVFPFFEAPWLFHWWIAAGMIYYLIGALELIENPSNFHILSPAVAVLSAHAVIRLSSFAATQLKQPVLHGVLAALLVMAVGVWGQRHSLLRSSYARQSYELGLALKAVSLEDELVVTVGEEIGCPVAIYYSGRRGWLFPPFGEIKDWERLPEDNEAIEIFERLRVKGAKWFGVVDRRKDDIWKERPRFAKHIERTSEIAKIDQSAIIYRVRSPAETKHSLQ
jgi:4-amino-4-deoxy-L-arabinose transferase-like glycosyltransferase